MRVIWLAWLCWYLFMGGLTAYAARRGMTFWLTPVVVALGWPLLWLWVIGGALSDEWKEWRKAR